MTDEFICYACRLPLEDETTLKFIQRGRGWSGVMLHADCSKRLGALTSAAVPREANEKP